MTSGIWTHIAALGAAFTLIRLVCFINAMHAARVPHRVILACVIFAAGAFLICISPLQGVEYGWQLAVLVWGATAYVWLDRRRPVPVPGKVAA